MILSLIGIDITLDELEKLDSFLLSITVMTLLHTFSGTIDLLRYHLLSQSTYNVSMHLLSLLIAAVLLSIRITLSSLVAVVFFMNTAYYMTIFIARMYNRLHTVI